MTDTADRLSYVVRPRLDGDGTVHRFEVTRPDLKHLTPDDLNAVRRAFGLEPVEPTEQWGVGRLGSWWRGE